MHVYCKEMYTVYLLWLWRRLVRFNDVIRFILGWVVRPHTYKRNPAFKSLKVWAFKSQ